MRIRDFSELFLLIFFQVVIGYNKIFCIFVADSNHCRSASCEEVERFCYLGAVFTWGKTAAFRGLFGRESG
jgi:hypothetical protein